MAEARRSGGVSPARQAWWRLRRNLLAMAGLGATVLVVLAVAGTPLLTRHDPTLQRPWLGALPPGATHPDVLTENRFVPGRPAATTAAIRALRRATITWQSVVVVEHRLTLRRDGTVRAITRSPPATAPGSGRLALDGTAVEVVRVLDPSRGETAPFPHRLDLGVGDPFPPDILADGERTLLLHELAPGAVRTAVVELDAGVVVAVGGDPDGIDPQGRLLVRGKDVLAVHRPDGAAVVAHHLLGTDPTGRDLWSRILYGGRISLMVGIVATAVSLVIGVLYGAISGYLGGRGDRLMMGAVDILYGLPFMFLVILLMSLFGRNILVLFAALGAVQWLTMARIVRGQTLSLREQEFVQAARLSGCSSGQIIRRHLVPNCVGPVIIYTTLTIPLVILEESFLAFLGLQVEWHGLVSWGGLVHDGVRDAGATFARGWLLWWPAGIMTLTLLALNALGSGLRDALDPRLQEGRA